MHPPPPRSAIGRLFAWLKTALTVTIALAGLALFLAWMGGAFHDKVRPGTVPVERPTLGSRAVVVAAKTVGVETITAVGSVQPRRKTDVASQILATVREIKPRPGERVKTGDVLVILDDRELLTQRAEATATLTAAEADLVTRQKEYDRLKPLLKSGSVSADEFSKVEGAFRIGESQVRRARESISRVEVQLSYTRITATSDAVVTDRFVEPGDLAVPGKPLLALFDPNDLELQASVPESVATGLVLGQKLGVRIDAHNLELTAAVREIVPQAQQASRTVLVKLALPVQSVTPLLPGTFGRLTIPVGRTERVWLPSAAVRRSGQLDLVEVVEPDNTLARRFVRTGREIDGNVEILAGVSAGERIALPK